MKQGVFAAALCAAIGSAVPAGAQVFTPSYQSPVLFSEIGVAFSDGPGDQTIEGIWRAQQLGLRVGLVDAGPEDLLSLGAEFRAPLQLAEAPFALAFTAGVQGLLGEFDAFGVQAGLTAGHRFVNPGLAVTPYIHPRIALIDGFGVDDDFEAEVLADFGLDVEFSSNLVLRLNAGLSDNSPDWGIGIALRR